MWAIDNLSYSCHDVKLSDLEKKKCKWTFDPSALVKILMYNIYIRCKLGKDCYLYLLHVSDE